VDIGRLGGAHLSAKRRERQRRTRWPLTLSCAALIRKAFEQGIPGEQLAEAAGLSGTGIYQIRDGRRQVQQRHCAR
jgi:hypothetical protein